MLYLYQISSADSFVNRIDSNPIPRDILYAPDKPSDGAAESVQQAEEAAKAYYSNTVFRVVSMEQTAQTENEIIFSVCVSKDGAVQESNRTIWLQLNNGTWEVVNEGY